MKQINMTLTLKDKTVVKINACPHCHSSEITMFDLNGKCNIQCEFVGHLLPDENNDKVPEGFIPIDLFDEKSKTWYGSMAVEAETEIEAVNKWNAAPLEERKIC